MVGFTVIFFCRHVRTPQISVSYPRKGERKRPFSSALAVERERYQIVSAFNILYKQLYQFRIKLFACVSRTLCVVHGSLHMRRIRPRLLCSVNINPLHRYYKPMRQSCWPSLLLRFYPYKDCPCRLLPSTTANQHLLDFMLTLFPEVPYPRCRRFIRCT